ncbi:MAG: mechanosensitive ion channel domain-containing protein [Planctomycetota bacterium]|jgi:potassium efflux system protein
MRSRLHPAVLIITAGCLLFPAVVQGQVLSAPPAPTTEDAGPTVETIQARIDELVALESEGQLDEAGALRLGLYREALAAARLAAESAKQRTQFESDAAQAPSELEAVQSELARPVADPDPQPPPDTTPDQLRQALDQAQADLKAARDRLGALKAEPEHRDTRLTEIPQQIAGTQQDLEDNETQLAALPLPEEPAALTDARRLKLQAERLALDAQIAVWNAERAKYEARTELLPLQQERWQRRVSQGEKLVAAWQGIVDQRRSEEAARQQQEALRAAARARPQVKHIADRNTELAETRQALQPQSEVAQQELAELRPDPEELERQLDGLIEKIDVVGLTNTVGLLLRKNRATLPDVRSHRRRIDQRQEQMASLEFDRLAYEDEYELLIASAERDVRAILDDLDPSLPESERSAIEAEAREQLRLKRQYLGDLNDEITLYFNRLEALNHKEQQIVELTERIADFIDERILWIRSAPPLGLTDIGEATKALAWLASPTEWDRLRRTAWADAKTDVAVIAPIFVVLALLVALRRWLKRRMRTIAARLANPSTDTFGRSIEATAITLVRAAAWPIVLWSMAAWLASADASSELELGQALAAGLRRAGLALFMFLLARELCLPQGLGEAHFRWRKRNVTLLRRHLTWLLFIGVPGSFVIAAMLTQANSTYEGSLGRLAYIASMAALAVFLRHILRPESGILRDYLERNRGGWVDRLHYVWYPLAVLVPLALIVLAGVGYFYTAAQLTRQLGETMLLILSVLMVYGLLLRWLFVAQRKLAWAEARKRAAEAEAERAASAEGEAVEPPVPVEEQKLDVSAIGAQTRQLLNGLTLFTLLIGFWGIWADALPAFGFLRGIELWQMGEAAAAAAPAAQGAEAAPAAPVVEMVTLLDLLKAIVILIVTAIVSKNIPGLLEITVLQRIPFEPGGRYATTTILRYTISIVGVVIAFAAIGVTWQKVQWIAAAITVGLGFGLQEIFGNFMSGLIILFERPIRVGDTVTVGDVSGTVTRIRIRATTVTDWDRKELVIPNKEFVTTKITNWSLSDALLRIIIPVGVAYGSDTEKATQLLLEAAHDCPHVLGDPPPRALFLGFGESALELDLRVFIPSIDHFLATKHELHEAIDKAFRDAGIEIAFPQRDIHVRTVRSDFPVRLDPGGTQET